ncbi:hypothetical protein [Oribacterium sp. P6A1]|uniref:hypothetical protein n=1 Tax=Oribacterium sp. P6A1 TaxID=1410612 RepID=UPI000AEBBC7C|nr:hypothetical protein [Oribacterium sp. P6A1]
MADTFVFAMAFLNIPYSGGMWDAAQPARLVSAQPKSNENACAEGVIQWHFLIISGE